MLVVISGGSQGLGASLAKLYAHKGADVVIVARTLSKLLATQSSIAAQNPTGHVHCISADIADPRGCEKVFREIGRIPDLVLCCAGACSPGHFLQMTPDELRNSLRTVYDTALYFSHAALRIMANAPDKMNNQRHLVYFSSTAAVFPFIGYSSYAPGKAGIRALADIVRQECLVHNIRISHVLPGTMDTEGYEHEELTKPAITKRIEGASPPLNADDAAKIVHDYLIKGNDTIYTDTIGWILGSAMLGTSPRFGWGILQTVAAIILAIFGWFVKKSIERDIRIDARDSSSGLLSN